MIIYVEYEANENAEFLDFVKDKMSEEAFNFASFLNSYGKLNDFIEWFDKIDIISLNDYMIFYQDEAVDTLGLFEEYEEEYL